MTMTTSSEDLDTMFPSTKNPPDFAKRDTTEGHGWIQWKGTEPCVKAIPLHLKA